MHSCVTLCMPCCKCQMHVFMCSVMHAILWVMNAFQNYVFMRSVMQSMLRMSKVCIHSQRHACYTINVKCMYLHVALCKLYCKILMHVKSMYLSAAACSPCCKCQKYAFMRSVMHAILEMPNACIYVQRYACCTASHEYISQKRTIIFATKR